LLAVDAEAGCGICHCRLHGGWNNLKPATLIRDSEERGWHSSGALERALQRQHFAKATPMYDTNADISFLRKILAALVTATLLAGAVSGIGVVWVMLQNAPMASVEQPG
jgi:hypothetical protein